MNSLIVRPLRTAAIIAAFCMVHHAGFAQTMDISVYSDITFDGSTVYGYVEGYDNSWGCSHTNHSVLAELVSPSGRYTSSWISGASGSGSLDFDEEEGTWTVNTALELWCSCLGDYYSVWGGSNTANTAEHTIDVDYTFESSQDVPGNQLYCNYSRCPSSPSTCGNAFQDVIYSTQSCAAGVRSNWTVKTFLGIPWKCTETSHQHMVDDPC